MELNRRLFNGELGPEVLPWLNEQHEVMHICAEHFEGVAVSAKNLSDYRTGPYQKWLTLQQGIEAQKTRAAYALELAQASGQDLSEAAAQLLAGQYLDSYASAAEGDEPDHKAAQAICALRKADQEKRKHEQRDRLLAQKDRELNLKEENAAWNFARKLLKAMKEKAAELEAVLADTGDEEQKMKDIVRITFGDRLLERMEQRRREALEE